jgi:hypothetical protein
MKYNKIIVDEAVSEEAFNRFINTFKSNGYDKLNVLFIANEHRGMPDNQILHHLIDEKTIFLTTDIVFHNKILSLNLKSYYVNKKKFIARKLKGIKIKKNFSLNKNDLNIKNDYFPPKTSIRSFLMPSSEKLLKRLRTKRRRIRSHFGGQSHLDQVAVTVSWHSCNSSTILGVRYRISSNIGIKALDASESYIREKILAENRDIVALNYALIISLQLMLHTIKTQIYFDSPKIRNPLLFLKQKHMNQFENLFTKLYSAFPSLEFIPSEKGFHIERLRKKLNSLSQNKSNEIVSGNINDIINKIENQN